MPHERYPPNDPREWMNRARSNLKRAKSEIPGVYLEDLCFDAQQAAEKALKALLILRGVDFPRVHDLADLMTLVEGTGEPVPHEVRDSVRLTRFAVHDRYPGVSEPVTAGEYRQAVAAAEEAVRWVEGLLPQGDSGDPE